MKFRQLIAGEKQLPYDVTVVWTRSSNLLPIGEIRADALNRRDEGYPYGLVIEHAFVLLDAGQAFQKRDPSELGPYEIIAETQALQPYVNVSGFEVTRHRRR